MEQFRGIFRFTYSGDAHIVLKTKVQVMHHVFLPKILLTKMPGEPSEPQTTGHSSDDRVKRHAGGKTAVSCTHASAPLSF
jgi:hypothetical protein